MRIFTWQMAEELAEAHMRALGFTDARRTGSGADGGIDVRAELAVAQVKHLVQPVGSPDIQRLRGAAHSVANAIFYSSSGYSSAALKVAADADVALFLFTSAGDVTPVNLPAQRLDRRDEYDESIRRSDALTRFQNAFERARTMLDTGIDLGMAISDRGLATEDGTLAAVGNRFVNRNLRIDDEWGSAMREAKASHPLSTAGAVAFAVLFEGICAAAQRSLELCEKELQAIETVGH
ncbi:restriction endonuclease [Curtobacterium sp. MCBD17_040]|uniref:restriction endonuclease n=1 Tax=Curtobacterium sp. MCBD17_040 TaxID=2175674 RepID=UPI0015E8873E|nr:restriction endonuclease [Curtobacterium sp. MCBD17_040]WIB65443.1 restriction endonuclease [Curtobacterium sp. MCBD17_040]